MNSEDFTYIDKDEEIKPIEFVKDELPKENNDNDDYITLPNWDLTPPFDSIDRGDMS